MSVEVGCLYPHPPYLPAPSQPGGCGNPVTDPAQTVNEHNARFMPGCGHATNTWLIIRDGYQGVPSDYVCCPICNYVQQIYPAGFLDTVPMILG